MHLFRSLRRASEESRHLVDEGLEDGSGGSEDTSDTGSSVSGSVNDTVGLLGVIERRVGARNMAWRSGRSACADMEGDGFQREGRTRRRWTG